MALCAWDSPQPPELQPGVAVVCAFSVCPVFHGDFTRKVKEAAWWAAGGTFSHDVVGLKLVFFKYIIYLSILEREWGTDGERERNTDLLFHLFVHSSVASCMCPHWGLNL